ncbi:MAG: hypothetical protein KGY99_11175, partial [Phycisphaerae bacterium]|nr:hypothetical protein [Phycisphaerae bacterium]
EPDVVWTSPDQAVYTPSLVRALLLKGLRSGTPVYGFSIPFVRAGALVGAGIDPQTNGAQAGELTARMLDGAPHNSGGPAAPRYQVAANLAAARSLEIALPDAVVREADVVIGGRDR